MLAQQPHNSTEKEIQAVLNLNIYWRERNRDANLSCDSDYRYEFSFILKLVKATRINYTLLIFKYIFSSVIQWNINFSEMKVRVVESEIRSGVA